jgi:hypothetical protein
MTALHIYSRRLVQTGTIERFPIEGFNVEIRLISSLDLQERLA